MENNKRVKGLKKEIGFLHDTIHALERQISELKEAWKLLRDSEAGFRRLFETAKDGILLLNADTGHIDAVNPFLINMLGYSEEEFLGKKIWEVGAFKYVEASKKAFLKLKTKEHVCYEGLPLEGKGGQLIDVEFVSNVYRVGSKKVIQCNIRNITELKKMEKELQEKVAGLETFSRVAVDREQKMIKLKKKLQELAAGLEK